MKSKKEGPHATFSCPKCEEPLVHTTLQKMPKDKGYGPYHLTTGHGAEALAFFKIDDHVGKPGFDDFREFELAGIGFLVVGCNNCGHVIGIVPSGAKSIGEDVSGIWKTLCDEIEAGKFSMLCTVKGMLAELRRMQFPDAEDEEYEHQQQVVEADEKILDPEKPDWQEIAKRTTEVIASVAEAIIERQLTNAADRLASSMANSIATAVGSAVDKRMEALEQRLAQQGTEKKQESPIPVRIVQVDPDAVMRVEDDGREREVRVTNTPLDVRQLPG